MGRPPSHPSTRHPRPVPGGGRCAHSGIPERPAPSPPPSSPARSLLLRAAFRLVARASGGRGTAREPRSPGGRGAEPEAGGNAPRRRAAPRAGTALGARAGRSLPRIPEKGACPRRAPARGRTPGGSLPSASRRTPPTPGGEGTRLSCRALQVPSPVRGPRPAAGLGGRDRAMGARIVLSEPSSRGPWCSSRDPTRRAPQRAGAAASGPAGSRGSGAPADTRLRGLAGRRPRQAPGERPRAGRLARRLRPLAGPASRSGSGDPSPPPGDKLAAGARAAGAGLRWRWQRAARCPGRPGEGARARPAACPPLPSPPRPPAPAPSWAAPGRPALPPGAPQPARPPGPLAGVSGRPRHLALPGSPGPRAPAHGARPRASVFVSMCAVHAARMCVQACKLSHLCAWRGAGLP